MKIIQMSVAAILLLFCSVANADVSGLNDEAMDELLPGTGGMRSVIERLDSLGTKKYGIALLGVIILVVVFWYLPLFPF